MGWSSTTFDVIDWDIFHPVYHKQTKKNLQRINKFSLNNLPTVNKLHNINSCEVIQCCSCGISIENNHHLFQCKARFTFLQHIRQELKEYKHELDPKLFHLFSDGIYIYVNETILPFIQIYQVTEQKGPKKNTNNPNPYQQEYKKTYKDYNWLLSKQESIG